MLELRLSVADLAETSFAFSALQETVFSLRAWRQPGHYALHLPWLSALRADFDRLDGELLRALVAPHRWVPDFLTPPTATPVPVFAEEMAALRATPPEEIPPDLSRTYRDLPLPDVLRTATDDPAAFRERVAGALERYWQRCVAPWWPRIRSVLEADVVYRSRRLALGGAQALFTDLGGEVRTDGPDGRLVVLLATRSSRYSLIAVDGRGLPLTPTLFANGVTYRIDTTGPPMLAYPARGRATVFQPAPPPTADALLALLGRPRARMLALLAHPATTTELAHRLGVTPAAVSQQLAVLAGAGLLTRSRSGRVVLYARSPLGDDLVSGRR